MNKLTEICVQISDALLELQVERKQAETFNSITNEEPDKT